MSCDFITDREGNVAIIPICEAHARHVGHNRDLCPSCAKDYKPGPRRDPATMPKRLRREPA